jgi:hypothetical protein
MWCNKNVSSTTDDLKENIHAAAATTDITPQTLEFGQYMWQLYCINMCEQQDRHQSEHLLC